MSEKTVHWRGPKSGVVSMVFNGALTVLAGLLWLVITGVGKIFLTILKYYVRRPLRFLVDTTLITVLASVLFAGARIYDRSLDAQIEAELVEKIDKNATFKRNLDRERASDNSREFMEVGGPSWIRETGIRAIIVEAKAANLDATETAVNLTIADRESGFNPQAKARGTTACGLFQFLKDTGENYGLSTRECMNPRANAHAQMRHFKKIISLPQVKAKLDGLKGEERLVVMYKEVYCRHHDGIRSSRCSDTASAVVTNGLDLLFASCKALTKTNEKRVSDPGFAREVAEVLEEAYVATRDVGRLVWARVAQMENNSQ